MSLLMKESRYHLPSFEVFRDANSDALKLVEKTEKYGISIVSQFDVNSAMVSPGVSSIYSGAFTIFARACSSSFHS